jgi:hypothetical protein
MAMGENETVQKECSSIEQCTVLHNLCSTKRQLIQTYSNRRTLDRGDGNLCRVLLMLRLKLWLGGAGRICWNDIEQLLCFS